MMWSHNDNFKRLFGKDLRRYCDPVLLDFDLIKFDDEIIKPPDGTSSRDFMLQTERWGQPAVDLVEALIGKKPERITSP